MSEFIFPSPWRIAVQTWEFKWVILGHAWRTYWVTMVGFGIAIVVGVLLGFVVGSFVALAPASAQHLEINKPPLDVGPDQLDANLVAHPQLVMS